MASDTIGILTFHRCINYGSYWQARCLVEGLRARGHHAVLLDHRSREVTWAEWRCALQPLLPRRTCRDDQRHYGRKARKFLAASDKLPLSAAFPLDTPEALDPLATVVVGSDEVWNLTHPWYGGRALFYGEGLPARRVVSYAASFGNYDASAGLEDCWSRRLGRFSALSVRDQNSRALVCAALGRDPPLVLDPVLQFPEPAVSVAQGNAGADRRPYVAIYGHGMPLWFEAQVAAAARDMGYRTISVGYRNEFADEQRLDAGPGEFAEVIAGAAAVATNFFHGCVFALLHGKPFACAPSPYRFNKVRDLTSALGAGRHLCAEDDDDRVAALLTEPLHPAIPAAIARLRAASDAYLAAALP